MGHLLGKAGEWRGVQGALTRTDPRSGDYNKLPDAVSKRSWDGVRGQQLESGGGEWTGGCSWDKDRQRRRLERCLTGLDPACGLGEPEFPRWVDPPPLASGAAVTKHAGLDGLKQQECALTVLECTSGAEAGLHPSTAPPAPRVCSTLLSRLLVVTCDLQEHCCQVSLPVTQTSPWCVCVSVSLFPL